MKQPRRAPRPAIVPYRRTSGLGLALLPLLLLARAEAATYEITAAFTLAPLLSGLGLNACVDPLDATSCVGGIASAMAYLRDAARSSIGNAFDDGGDGTSDDVGIGNRTIFLPFLDRESPFAQMHPLGWGVNALVLHQHYQSRLFLSSPSLLTSDSSTRDLTFLRTSEMPFLLTNGNVPPSNPWKEYTEMVHFDEMTNLAVLHILGGATVGDSARGVLVDQIESALGALDFVRRVNEDSGCYDSSAANAEQKKVCYTPTIVYNDLDPHAFKSFLTATISHSNPPAGIVGPSGLLSDDDDTFPNLNENSRKIDGTWVGTFRLSGSVLQRVRLTMQEAEDGMGPDEIVGYQLEVDDLYKMPYELRDEDWIADQTFLQNLANEAFQNNPVLGQSGPMPLVRPPYQSEIRNCMGGECPLGNLWTDALRWNGGNGNEVDLSFAPSGGLRGPGWEEGDVTVWNLWESMPFANTLCTGVMSGVSLYRLLNHSTALATFESTWTATGDHLLQTSGVRYTYNTELEGIPDGRLISVDVWNQEKERYEPLERLKLYTFAVENFLCQYFSPYPTLLGSDLGKIEGEVPGSVDDRSVHDLVANYLRQLDGPYDTSIQGRLRNDTESTVPMNFVQTEDTCPPDTFWEEDVQTCSVCPGSTHVAFSDETVELTAIKGDAPSARVVLSNRELFDVTVSAKRVPSWVRGAATISENDVALEFDGQAVIEAGSSAALEFVADTIDIEAGTSARSTVSYGVIDDAFPGCFHNRDISFDVVLKVVPEEDKNQLGTSVRAVGLALMGVAVVTSIVFGLWTFRKRSVRAVRASQPLFLGMICGGTLVLAASIAPLSIDDGIASQRGCDIACMATPWTVSVGFTVAFSALFSKMWRINRVMQSAKSFKRVKVTERDVMMPFAVLFTLNFAILLAWTLADPLRWVRSPVGNNPFSTYGRCSAEGGASKAFAAILLVLNAGALVLACFEAYHSRNISDEYSESKYIAIAVFSWFQVLVVGIPAMFLVEDDPTASFFLRTALIFIVCMSMLLLVFMPKILHVRNKNFKTSSSKYSSSSSKMNSSAGRIRMGISSADTDELTVDRSMNDHGMRVVRLVEMEEKADELKKQLADSKDRIRELERLLDNGEEPESGAKDLLKVSSVSWGNCEQGEGDGGEGTNQTELPESSHASSELPEASFDKLTVDVAQAV